MTIAELEHIEKLATRVPEKGRILEIGSFYGRSTWTWSKSIPSSAVVHCIDPWNDWPILGSHRESLSGIVPDGDLLTNVEIFEQNIKDCSNVTFTQNYSEFVLPSMPYHHFDLIFLDGMHSNPAFHNDLIFSYPLVRSGGVLCGHDFSPSFPDIISEVTRFADHLGLSIERESDSTIWVLQL